MWKCYEDNLVCSGYINFFVVKLLPELCISQICFPDFIRARILLPIFEANTTFHIDLFVIIIKTRVYPYIYIYALEVLGSATDINGREIRV